MTSSRVGPSHKLWIGNEQRDIPCRVCLAKRREKRRQYIGSNGHRCRDNCCTHFGIARDVEFALQFPGSCDNLVSPNMNPPAGASKHQSSATTLEQPDAELGFEEAQMCSYYGLRHRHALCGACDALQFANHTENLEFVQSGLRSENPVQCSLPDIVLMLCI